MRQTGVEKVQDLLETDEWASTLQDALMAQLSTLTFAQTLQTQTASSLFLNSQLPSLKPQGQGASGLKLSRVAGAGASSSEFPTASRKL